jgi:hypothetical protein
MTSPAGTRAPGRAAAAFTRQLLPAAAAKCADQSGDHRGIFPRPWIGCKGRLATTA